MEDLKTPQGITPAQEASVLKAHDHADPGYAATNPARDEPKVTKSFAINPLAGYLLLTLALFVLMLLVGGVVSQRGIIPDRGGGAGTSSHP